MNDNRKREILDSLLSIKEDLPKKQKQLCNFLIENFTSLEMYSLSELSHRANVGVSTIMRVIKKIGFESYKDLKKEIHEEVISSRPTWWHMERSFEENDENHVLASVSKEVTALLGETVTKTNIDKFNHAIAIMSRSHKIGLLGLRSSKAAVNYFGYLMEGFYPDIVQLSNDSDLIYDRIFKFTENDILILVINTPYTKLSIEVAKFCHERGVPIVLITDLLSNPAASYSTVIINTKSSENQYSIIPTIAVLESLVIEFGRTHSDTSVSQLHEMGRLLNEKNITGS